MPSLSLPKAGLCISMMFAGLQMTGCGGDTPTTRQSDTTVNTPVTYQMTVNSIVPLTNVRVRAINLNTGEELGSAILANGTAQNLKIQSVDLNPQQILLLEIAPIGDQSSYVDPISQKTVPFTSTLHALIHNSNIKSDVIYAVNPYSDLVYQRSLYRSGEFNPLGASPSFANINSQTIQAANSELISVFQVKPNLFPLTLSSKADLKNIVLTTVNNNSSTTRFFNQIFMVGHIQHYANLYPNDNAPYLNFAKVIGRDFSDGDLDGLSLAGLGDSGVKRDTLNQTVVAVAPIENNDPTHNNRTQIALDQKSQRESYNNALGNTIRTLFSTVYTSTSNEAIALAETDFTNLTYAGSQINNNVFNLHHYGAGNYTRAFGLTDTLSKIALNADDTGLVSDIEQIIGTYSNSNGCKLTITANGQVSLSQDGLTMLTFINRDLSDSLQRTSVDSTQYLLNTSNPSNTMPNFVQVRTNGAVVLSATAGRSLELNPETLAQTDLSCTFN